MEQNASHFDPQLSKEAEREATAAATAADDGLFAQEAEQEAAAAATAADDGALAVTAVCDDTVSFLEMQNISY